MDEILKFFKDNPTYYLATTDANGNPQVRPFGTMTKFEGRLYFQTGNVKNVFAEMMNHPRIAICNFNGTEWIRLEANAVRDDRMEAREAVLDDYPSLKEVYAADDGNCEVFYLTDIAATISSFGSEPRAISL